MKNEELEKVLKTVFTHAGYVRTIELEWVAEGTCLIKVTFLPWSETEVVDVTDMLLDSDLIMNDDMLYLQVPNKNTTVTATITVTVTDPEWQRSLARQMGYIVGQELRAAVAVND